MPIIDLRRGDDFVIRATFTDENDMPPPGGMVGWTLAASLRFPECPPIGITATWIDALGGVAAILYDAADTLNLQIGDYEFRVRAINPSGDGTSAPVVTVRVSD